MFIQYIILFYFISKLTYLTYITYLILTKLHCKNVFHLFYHCYVNLKIILVDDLGKLYVYV